MLCSHANYTIKKIIRDAMLTSIENNACSYAQGHSIQCDGYDICCAEKVGADESAKKMTQECEAGNKLQWLAITHMRSIIQGISDGATYA